jgi:hypothetical protein
LGSEKDLKCCAEEAIIFKGFGRCYVIRDVYSFISTSLKKKIIKKKILIDSQSYRLENLDCECQAQTINQSSNVDGPDGAADEGNLLSTQILRQTSAIESTQYSEIGNICLTSEINPKILVYNISIVSEPRSSEEEFCRSRARSF